MPKWQVLSAICGTTRQHAPNTHRGTHLIDARMTEVTQQITVIQSRHGKFRNDHLGEGRESREDALLFTLEAKAGCCGKIATLHDA